MWPPLASVLDFAARTPGGVAVSDEERVEALLLDASSLARVEAGKTWVNDEGQLEDVPDVVAVVVIAAARRAFANPDGKKSETVEDYTYVREAGAGGGVYLTEAEKALVRRAAGRSGVWSLPVTRATSDGSDLPGLYPSFVGGSGAAEEVDPFGEGWPG